MKYINLLINSEHKKNLKDFVTIFFDAINISAYEERHSSNYVDGHYFKGGSGPFVFTVAISDEEDHQGLPYWVQVRSEIANSDIFELEIDNMVKDKLLPLGFKVARVLNFGKVEEQRFDY
jgi:hypothetical protein